MSVTYRGVAEWSKALVCNTSRYYILSSQVQILPSYKITHLVNFFFRYNNPKLISMFFFSPFEESAIFSYGWLFSQLLNIDLLVFSNLLTYTALDYYNIESFFDVYFVFCDAVDYVYYSFFIFIDSHYLLIYIFKPVSQI